MKRLKNRASCARKGRRDESGTKEGKFLMGVLFTTNIRALSVVPVCGIFGRIYLFAWRQTTHKSFRDGFDVVSFDGVFHSG